MGHTGVQHSRRCEEDHAARVVRHRPLEGPYVLEIERVSGTKITRHAYDDDKTLPLYESLFDLLVRPIDEQFVVIVRLLDEACQT
jgi:hypothetical protein